MTRLVRRPAAVQPLRRGRAAAGPNADQSPLTPLTVFRQGPPCTGPVREKVIYREKIVYRDKPIDIHPVLIKLYKLMPYLFNVLDRPWKWLVALVALVVLSVMIGSLL